MSCHVMSCHVMSCHVMHMSCTWGFSFKTLQHAPEIGGLAAAFRLCMQGWWVEHDQPSQAFPLCCALLAGFVVSVCKMGRTGHEAVVQSSHMCNAILGKDDVNKQSCSSAVARYQLAWLKLILATLVATWLDASCEGPSLSSNGSGVRCCPGWHGQMHSSTTCLLCCRTQAGLLGGLHRPFPPPPPPPPNAGHLM